MKEISVTYTAEVTEILLVPEEDVDAVLNNFSKEKFLKSHEKCVKEDLHADYVNIRDFKTFVTDREDCKC